MDRRTGAALPPALVGLLLLAPFLAAQERPPQRGGPPGPDAVRPGEPPPFGPRGPGGPGGFMGQKRKLVQQFDKDGDVRLNKEERQAAREFLRKERSGGGRGGFGPGGRGGFGPGNFLTGPLLQALD